MGNQPFNRRLASRGSENCDVDLYSRRQSNGKHAWRTRRLRDGRHGKIKGLVSRSTVTVSESVSMRTGKKSEANEPRTEPPCQGKPPLKCSYTCFCRCTTRWSSHGQLQVHLQNQAHWCNGLCRCTTRWSSHGQQQVHLQNQAHWCNRLCRCSKWRIV